MNKIIKIVLTLLIVLILFVFVITGYLVFDFIYRLTYTLDDYKNIYEENYIVYNEDAELLFNLANHDHRSIIIEDYWSIFTIDKDVKNYYFLSNGLVVSTSKKYNLSKDELSIIKKCNVREYLKAFKCLYISREYISFDGGHGRELVYSPDKEPSGNGYFMRGLQKIDDGWYCCYID